MEIAQHWPWEAWSNMMKVREGLAREVLWVKSSEMLWVHYFVPAGGSATLQDVFYWSHCPTETCGRQQHFMHTLAWEAQADRVEEVVLGSSDSKTLRFWMWQCHQHSSAISEFEALRCLQRRTLAAEGHEKRLWWFGGGVEEGPEDPYTLLKCNLRGDSRIEISF